VSQNLESIGDARKILKTNAEGSRCQSSEASKSSQKRLSGTQNPASRVQWLKTVNTKRKNPPVWRVFCFIFKNSNLGGANLTFFEDLYLPLFVGDVWDARTSDY
jgi:hypothetical protein